MPHSLRAKLSGLRYKGILEDKDYKRLCKALDNENVLEQIRDEIKQEIEKEFYLPNNDINTEQNIRTGYLGALCIIDKYMKEQTE